MKRAIVALLLAAFGVVGATTQAEAAPRVPTGSITLNESGPYAFGDGVTFTTSVSGLRGHQYPLVYVVCYSLEDGHLLYGQLDYPETTFILGGGSSPWHEDRDDAECVGRLYVYGNKDGYPLFLSQTPKFIVDGGI